MILTRISSCALLLRITAYIMRAVKIFREKVAVSGFLSSAEIHESSLLWVRYVQAQAFSRDIDSLKTGKTLTTGSPLK